MANLNISPPKLSVQDLTWREQEVLGLLAKRLSNKEIGANLHLAESTVKWYNQQIFSKLRVTNRKQAVQRAGDLKFFETQAKGFTEEKAQHLSNLPAQLTSFIGRKKEVAEIKQLLVSSRLVTLTGAGGSGKTRLALRVARDLIDFHKDGVWLVELAAITDPRLVPNEIANVLKINSRGETPRVELLKRSLESKHLLLVLDNFEHLDEAALMLGELLALASNLTILVTSRAKLNIYGEQEYLLSPLKLPKLNQRENTEDLLNYESIVLFIQRAKASQPNLTLKKEDIEAIARICVRLDGLPLAIELSAPLAKIYGFDPLAQRLEEDLEAIPKGPRDLPKRQQTLRATMDWSYRLLDEDEKILFDRLSAFSGGGTLEAIETICNARLTANTIDKLTSLVEKNLVFSVEARDGEVHFTMLETIKEYSHEHLAARPGANEVYRKHAAYYAGLAERSNKEIRGQLNNYWLKRLMVENLNLRSALVWSLEGDEHEFGLRMVGALAYHWVYNGLSAENSPWIALALENSKNAVTSLRAAVLRTAGSIAYSLSDLDRSRDMFQTELKLYQDLGDEFNEAIALTDFSIASLGSSRELSEILPMTFRALEIFSKFDDKAHMADTHNVIGELTRFHGDYKTAKKHYQLCLALSKESGERLREAMQYNNLGFIAFHEGDYEGAARNTKKSLSIFVEMDSYFGIANHLACLAGPVAALGFPKRAARLLGAANAHLETLGTDQEPADQPEIELYIRTTQKALSETAFQQAWQEGQRMTIQEAVAYALSEEEAEE